MVLLFRFGKKPGLPLSASSLLGRDDVGIITLRGILAQTLCIPRRVDFGLPPAPILFELALHFGNAFPHSADIGRFIPVNRSQAMRRCPIVLAERFGCTPAQLALAWVLAQWRGVLPIPGVKTREHLEDNIGALDLELSVADLDYIASALPEDLVYGERYPESMMQTVNV